LNKFLLDKMKDKIITTLFFFFWSFIFIRSICDRLPVFKIGQLRLDLSELIAMGIVVIAVVYRYTVKKIACHQICFLLGLWVLVNFVFASLSLFNFGLKGVVGIREGVRLGVFFFIFLVSYNYVRAQARQFPLKHLFVALIIPLIVSLFQLITRTGDITRGVHRIFGTLPHANQFAIFLILFFVLSWYIAVFSRKKLAWVSMMFLEIFALVFTFSISGFMVWSIIVVFFFFAPAISSKQKLCSLLFLVCLLVFFLGFLFRAPEFQTRKNRLARTNITRMIKEDNTRNSLEWRVRYWHSLIQTWSHKPFLGYGLNTLSLINRGEYQGRYGYMAHNDYIKYLVETGMVGLGLYIGFLIFVGTGIWKSYAYAVGFENKYLLYVMFAFFISLQIGAFGSNYINSTVVQFYFWAALGLALGQADYAREVNSPVSIER